MRTRRPAVADAILVETLRIDHNTIFTLEVSSELNLFADAVQPPWLSFVTVWCSLLEQYCSRSYSYSTSTYIHDKFFLKLMTSNANRYIRVILCALPCDFDLEGESRIIFKADGKGYVSAHSP